MYFSSKKGKWYNRALQTKPSYRYLFTCLITVLFLSGWFAVYTWLDDIILNQNIALRTMHGQMIQLAQAERLCTELSCSLPKVREELACFGNRCCSIDFCQKQINTVIELIGKSKLTLSSYGGEKTKEKDWCKCSESQFCFTGTLDNISQFFSSLGKSGAMIRCTNFSCEGTDAGRYNATCSLELISV